MLIQRLNRSDPETILCVCKNSYSTAAITIGMPVMWDYVTDADGIAVTQQTAAAAGLGGRSFAGIVTTASIAIGDYGLIQTYGHCAAILVHASTSATTSTGNISKGQTLRPAVVAEFAMEPVLVTGTQANCFGNVIAGAAALTWTAASIIGFVKAM